jgi:hypothetical protein
MVRPSMAVSLSSFASPSARWQGRSMDAKLKLLFISYFFFFLLVVLSFLLAGLQHSVSNRVGNGLINLRQGYDLLLKKQILRV